MAEFRRLLDVSQLPSFDAGLDGDEQHGATLGTLFFGEPHELLEVCDNCLRSLLSCQVIVTRIEHDRGRLDGRYDSFKKMHGIRNV